MPSKEFRRVLTEIREDLHSGASSLALKALEAFQDEVKRKTHISREVILEYSSLLRKAQPEMTLVDNALAPLFLKLLHEEISSDDLVSLLKKEITFTKSRKQQTIDNLAQTLERFNSFVTISQSSTVLNGFQKVADSGKGKKIFVLESRPRNEGLDSAQILAKMGYDVTLVTDASMAFVGKEAEVAIIGADSLLWNGSIINKIGSFPLSLVMKHFGKTFTVASSTNKLNLAHFISRNFRSEEKDPQEVLPLSKRVSGLKALNPYFEMVPGEFIDFLITEEGIMRAPFTNLKEIFEKQAPSEIHSFFLS